ncbi:hypothetical protein PG995_005697 [Apiospora arundinis]
MNTQAGRQCHGNNIYFLRPRRQYRIRHLTFRQFASDSVAFLHYPVTDARVGCVERDVVRQASDQREISEAAIHAPVVDRQRASYRPFVRRGETERREVHRGTRPEL